jgi:hypothetical protein
MEVPHYFIKFKYTFHDVKVHINMINDFKTITDKDVNIFSHQ